MIVYENIPMVFFFLFFFCLRLDHYIWKKNADWQRNNPGHLHHPYSPMFTAIGTAGILVASLLLVPWETVAVIFGLFLVFGGFMWYLHDQRWLSRTENSNQQQDD